MSARWTGYYKIVEPVAPGQKVSDNQGIADSGTYGNYTWYQRLVQGSASRMSKYREYDLMDNDIEVARALDTIAEEMIGNSPKTSEPLLLEFADDNVDMNNTEILTIKAALRHWCNMHQWDRRLFKISRNLIKYGDYFFSKKGQFGKWEPVNPKNVEGAIVDQNDITNIIAWQVKSDTKKPQQTYGSPTSNTSGGTAESEIIPASELVRFTLNDDMSETAPFGESVLRSVYRTHKQKELLEDAIIIYRIQRAPERRVFYIDVGKMPPQRVKQFLEGVKNEIKQKKIPTLNGGKDTMDAVYNPQAMSEDFFFAQRADGKGSRVETLPGGQGLGELADLEYFQEKVWRGLRVPISYMNPGQDGGVFNDGKVGVAYIQELRFALFVERLQTHVEDVMDKEFKDYLRASKIRIDETSFKIRLPEPSNFGLYRQLELDSQLLNSVQTADGIQYLSKRFILSRYLNMDKAEVAENERMLREEMDLDPDKDNEFELQKIYRPDAMEGMDGGMGDDFGGDMGGGPSLGGGLGMDAGEDLGAGGDEPEL